MSTGEASAAAKSFVPAIDVLLEAATIRKRPASDLDGSSDSAQPSPIRAKTEASAAPAAQNTATVEPRADGQLRSVRSPLSLQCMTSNGQGDDASSTTTSIYDHQLDAKGANDTCSETEDKAADSDTSVGGPFLSRPCSECRMSRVRCSRELPCQRCTRLGLHCKLAPALQRGRPSKQAQMMKMIVQGQHPQGSQSLPSSPQHPSRTSQFPSMRNSALSRQSMMQQPLAGGGMRQVPLASSAPQSPLIHSSTEPPSWQLQQCASPLNLRPPAVTHQQQSHKPTQPLRHPMQMQGSPVYNVRMPHSSSSAHPLAASGTTGQEFRLDNSGTCESSPGGPFMTMIPMPRLQNLLKFESQAAHLQNQLEILRLQLWQMGCKPYV